MELNVQHADNVTVVHVMGRVDTSSSLLLRKHLIESASQPIAQVVVDLADVQFIDSSGLAALVHGMRSCRENGGDLCLCSLQRAVRMVFELTRLDSAIDIYSGKDEAIAALARQMYR